MALLYIIFFIALWQSKNIAFDRFCFNMGKNVLKSLTDRFLLVTTFPYRQLRARRALLIFKDAPLGARRALLLYNGDSALLVLNGTYLNSDSALLLLN